MNLPDPALLEIFAAEQAEHVQRMRSAVERLGAGADPQVLDALLRHAHTLKGAARAAGFEPTEKLVHALEGAFSALHSGQLPPGDRLSSLFVQTLDSIEDILASVLSGRAIPETETLLRDIDDAAGIAILPAPPPVEPAPEAPPASAPALTAEFVRINAKSLDDLMSASSELIAFTSSDGAGEAAQADTSLREWMRLRQSAAAYLRTRQNDPELKPVLDCIQGAERDLQSLVAEVRALASTRRSREWELRRLALRLGETAFRVRMVGAETVFGNFGSMLRNLAQEHGKQIDFRAEGLDLPADRVVLQSLKDPVLQLLRNALSHGIEPEAERTAVGKPSAGKIRLLVRSQGDRLHVTVEDDGQGLDRRAVANEAARQGILSEPTPSEEGLAELIFRPGFSTSSALTTLSGRGLGLSIVRHEVTRLHGEIRVHSEPGKGTAITLSVPLSVSSQQVLLVEVSGHTFGILTSFTQQLCRLKPQDIRTFEGKPAIVVDSLPIPLFPLSELLGLSAAPPIARGNSLQAVIVAADGRVVALAVDRLLDVRSAVIRPLGLSPENTGWSSGAIPLADGSVAVILNMTELLARDRGSARTDSFAAPDRQQVSKILVVDDSITTRTLEKNLLEAHGYEVLIAVDGIEALATLRAETVDLVITDLSMPRMDGFQLLEEIRKDKALEQTPVIIVSSMESRQDQERGQALGADAYIVKRKFDQRELLETVRQIL